MSPESAGSNGHPALSVVIPTRDSGDVVRRSTESAQQSPRPDIEAIVVDDGSNDDTKGRHSQVADDRFRYHRLKSSGNANRARTPAPGCRARR